MPTTGRSCDTLVAVEIFLEIDDSLGRRLRQEAARRGTTMSALVEAGLQCLLPETEPSALPVAQLLPLPSWDGGKELVDISNRDALYKVMEEA